MNRRDLLKGSALIGLVASIPSAVSAATGAIQAKTDQSKNKPGPANRLTPPKEGNIPVAFLISDGAVIIDFCGPWEVFQDAGNFDLYTVAETTKTIRASGGMQIVPDYNFQNAPVPKVVVIPAQSGNKAALQYIRKSAQNADVVMSVCTGALLLATTGLLSGKSATTHHSSYRTLKMTFPDINIIRGVRYVEDGKFATSGGLSCGIDLALRVVERYYGREVASNTAYQMEYQGQGWMNPASNDVYAKRPVAAEGKALCPVCEMQVDLASSPKWAYKGKTYYFCSEGHKQQFQTTPQKFLDAIEK